MKPCRFPFTPFPDGVFAVLFSHELKRKQVISIVFMNQKISLFRTEQGDIGAVNRYCPHLGADLSYGLVKNDTLQCPFHGMRFKTDGTCTAKNKMNESIKYPLQRWHVFEKYGIIFLTYNPSQRELSITFPEWDFSVWSKPYEYSLKIKSHPQEILENSVDQLHFYQVHQYQSVKIVEPFKVIDAEFMIDYVLERKSGIFGENKKITLDLKIHAYGLGLSSADIYIPKYNLHIKQMVFPTPIDGEHIDIRALTSVKIIDKVLSLPRCLTPYFIRKQITNLLTRLTAKEFVKDFLPDLTIWENKKYIEYPEYFTEDGEFEKYRAWATQFYRNEIK